MTQTVLITLVIAGADTGPFDLYSDANGFTSPFEVDVPKASLVAGYTSILVPATATLIKIVSKGVCTNELILPIIGTLATTTTTTTSTPASTTTSSTTTGAPTTTSTTSSTSTTEAPCQCYLLQNTEAPLPPDTNYGTGVYVDCDENPLLWFIPDPLGQIYICTKNPSSIIVSSGNVSVTLISPSDPLYINCSC